MRVRFGLYDYLLQADMSKIFITGKNFYQSKRFLYLNVKEFLIYKFSEISEHYFFRFVLP